MAAGTPVVSTTVGGLPEQVPKTVGKLAPPKQPQEFAEAVDELLSNETRRAEMGENALELVKSSYSWDAVAREAIEQYQKILE
jgi:glycosyltransferase involved in cell wall biosynthesis